MKKTKRSADGLRALSVISQFSVLFLFFLKRNSPQKKSRTSAEKQYYIFDQVRRRREPETTITRQQTNDWRSVGERDSEVNIGGTGTFGITQSGFKEPSSHMDSTEFLNPRRDPSDATLFSTSSQKNRGSRDDALKFLERENSFLIKKVGVICDLLVGSFTTHRLGDAMRE